MGLRLRPLAPGVLLAALLLAACGGGDEPASVSTVTTTVTETVQSTSTVTATESGSGDTTQSADADLTTATFQMPSRNIGCLYGFQQLRCDILSGLDPEPDEECEFDWVGVTMGVTGAAAANCGSDTVYEAGAPVLEYGQTWSRGGILCESDEDGLFCTSPEGHEFALARGSWSAS